MKKRVLFILLVGFLSLIFISSCGGDGQKRYTDDNFQYVINDDNTATVEEVLNLNMTEVVVPNTIKNGIIVNEIRYSIFQNCHNLRKITFGPYLEKNNYCAAECDSVEEIVFENTNDKTLDHIGIYAFYNCKNLKHVTIPNTVKSLGFHAFDGCSALRIVDFLPNSIEEICVGCFIECSILEQINFPTNLKKIAEDMF